LSSYKQVRLWLFFAEFACLVLDLDSFVSLFAHAVVAFGRIVRCLLFVFVRTQGVSGVIADLLSSKLRPIATRLRLRVTQTHPRPSFE
jgi:hypothetical protein